MSLSERITLIFDNESLSQEEFAKKTGVSRPSVSLYMNGKKKPSFAFIENLYKLGYNINWLFSGEGQMKRGVLDADYVDENLEELITEYLKNQANDRLNELMEDEIFEYIAQFTDFMPDDPTIYEHISETIKGRKRLDITDIIKGNFLKILYTNIFWDKVYKKSNELNISENVVRSIYDSYDEVMDYKRLKDYGLTQIYLNVDLTEERFESISVNDFFIIFTLIHLLKEFENSIKDKEISVSNAKHLLNGYLTQIDNKSIFNNELRKLKDSLLLFFIESI